VRDILFVAGEVSGDLHAAGVARELVARHAPFRLAGIGGDEMRAAGVDLVEHAEQLAVMGFVEVLRHVPKHWALLHELKRRIRSGQVALVVLIDYPTFNMKVAEAATAAGVPVLYYITPQVWAWGSDRLARLARTVTKAAVILPFEEALLRRHHIDATFVHYDSVAKLTQAGFTDLAKMSDVAPELADSFMGASPTWVHAHPVLAEIVDEAWIKAAQVFNNDSSQWVSAAVKYAGGTTADATAVHDGLLQADTFPVAKSSFSAASATAQANLAAEVGAINTKPALSNWFTETYWDQASAAMNIS